MIGSYNYKNVWKIIKLYQAVGLASKADRKQEPAFASFNETARPAYLQQGAIHKDWSLHPQDKPNCYASNISLYHDWIL